MAKGLWKIFQPKFLKKHESEKSYYITFDGGESYKSSQVGCEEKFEKKFYMRQYWLSEWEEKGLHFVD